MAGHSFTVLVSVIAAALTASAAVAQSNEIYLLQDSSQSSTSGNTLFIDQSAASNSSVGTETQRASQIGGGNSGTITLEGDGSEVAFFQSGDGNTATLTGDALASILLDQQGTGNTGTITVGAGGNTGELLQDGDDNTGSVSVFGDGNRGRLEQQGNDNTFNLEVTGFSIAPGFAGTDVTVQQVGNGLTQSGVGGFDATSPGAALQVITNSAGTVTITQTQF